MTLCDSSGSSTPALTLQHREPPSFVAEGRVDPYRLQSIELIGLIGLVGLLGLIGLDGLVRLYQTFRESALRWMHLIDGAGFTFQVT
jgi:hypothetical protein